MTSTSPNEYDVLCGKDSSCMIRHPGNRIFRERIDMHKDTYQVLSKHQKMVVTKEIIEMLRSTYGTRFLKKAAKNELHGNNENDDVNCWIELTSHEVRDKVGHALRFASGRVKQQSPKAKKTRRVSPEPNQRNHQDNHRNDSDSGRKMIAGPSLVPPPIHLNNLNLTQRLSSVNSDQLADIIKNHNSSTSNKATRQQDKSSRTSSPVHHHQGDVNNSNAAAGAVTATTTSKNETTTITARTLANSDNGDVDRDTTLMDYFAEEMFQRQQAIFSSMSMRRVTRTAAAAESSVVTKGAASTATTTTAVPLLDRASSSQSLWHLMSAPIMEEV